MCNTHPLARQVRFRQLFLDQLSTGQGLLKHMTRAGSALEELGLDQVKWGDDDGGAATALLLLTPRLSLCHTRRALPCLVLLLLTPPLHSMSSLEQRLSWYNAVLCVCGKRCPFSLTTQTCTP